MSQKTEINAEPIQNARQPRLHCDWRGFSGTLAGGGTEHPVSDQPIQRDVKLRETLSNHPQALRDLKRIPARRGPQAMAVVLVKDRNEAGVRFRARPKGLSEVPNLCVGSS